MMIQTGKVKSVVLTEKIGDAWLSRRDHERNPTVRHVSALKKCIEHNGWMNNSVICVTTDGELLDGQNRLLALRELGWPSIRVNVCVFTPDEATDSIRSAFNRSRSQSLSDTMKMVFGWESATRMVSGYSAINRIVNGDKTPNDDLVMVAMDNSMPEIMKTVIRSHNGNKNHNDSIATVRAAFAIASLANGDKTISLKSDLEKMVFSSTVCAARRIFDLLNANDTSHGMRLSWANRVIYATDRHINNLRCEDLVKLDSKRVDDVALKYIAYAKTLVKFS